MFDCITLDHQFDHNSLTDELIRGAHYGSREDRWGYLHEQCYLFGEPQCAPPAQQDLSMQLIVCTRGCQAAPFQRGSQS